jgi:hypothetical protein
LRKITALKPERHVHEAEERGHFDQGADYADEGLS